jgi:hypothetical protein
LNSYDQHDQDQGQGNQPQQADANVKGSFARLPFLHASEEAIARMTASSFLRLFPCFLINSLAVGILNP